MTEFLRTARGLLDEYVAAFVGGDHNAVADLFAEDGTFEVSLTGHPTKGREAIREQLRVEIGGLSDASVTWDHILERGNTVLAEGLFEAHLLGAFEEIRFRFFAALSVHEGKITRLVEHLDARRVKPSKRMRVHGPPTRRSPYWDGAEAAGQQWFIVYNHMYFPLGYRTTPYSDYVALTERATLWDVGCERQTQFKGPDAIRLVDYLSSRDLTKLQVGQCRYTLILDTDGRVINDPVVLRPFNDTVWVSHGDVDITFWAKGFAEAKELDVEVSEPDVAPLQVQGPASREVLRSITDTNLDELGYYRCVVTRVAGIDAVVSNTGWSGGTGYEIYPFTSDRAMELWNAILEAGQPFGLQVTGANPIVALERGVTDLSIWTGLDTNPYENGLARIVDLDRDEFIGRKALKKAVAEGITRKTVGLVFDDQRIPWQDGKPWPLVDEEGRSGYARWANFSFGLRKYAALGLVDADIPAHAPVRVDADGIELHATVVDLPLVPRTR
jgi:aminomethyltransferase